MSFVSDEPERCTRCNKLLKSGTEHWLELDTSNNKFYPPGEVPPLRSQGCFPFGPECVKKANQFNCGP